MKSRTILFGLALLWFGLDQAIKHWIQDVMVPSQSIAVWPGVFHLTFVHNTGAAFSMFEQHPATLTWVTVFLFVAILIMAMTRPNMDRQELIGFSLVLGGALGNITDRLFLGKVVDYLDFIVIRYPVFNLADACIFVGVCLLILHQFKPGSAR